MKINRVKLIIALAERNLTIVRLAALAGLSRGTISAVKNGKSCTYNTATHIARALDVSVDSLREEAI